MPYVHIELLEGRTDEQKQALMRDVVDAVVKTPMYRRKACT